MAATAVRGGGGEAAENGWGRQGATVTAAEVMAVSSADEAAGEDSALDLACERLKEANQAAWGLLDAIAKSMDKEAGSFMGGGPRPLLEGGVAGEAAGPPSLHSQSSRMHEYGRVVEGSNGGSGISVHRDLSDDVPLRKGSRQQLQQQLHLAQQQLAAQHSQSRRWQSPPPGSSAPPRKHVTIPLPESEGGSPSTSAQGLATKVSSVAAGGASSGSSVMDMAMSCMCKDDYCTAAELLQQRVAQNEDDPDAWRELGYCYFMMNDLQSSYAAYQRALCDAGNQLNPRMWYGIGRLYEHYSITNAHEAFEACLQLDPKFELAHEVKLCMGVILKKQGRLAEALDTLQSALPSCNMAIWRSDVFTQIGHIQELQNNLDAAIKSFGKSLEYNPENAKSLQQLGWLHCIKGENLQAALDCLKRATELKPQDGLGWYLLGRCYIARNQRELAYKAYEKAIDMDPHNPNAWCSLGVLCYQMGETADALDAFMCAIKIDPNYCEVWHNVGTLYDSCNQVADALDAYQKALELGANSHVINQRIRVLMQKQQMEDMQHMQLGGGGMHAAPPAGARPSMTMPQGRQGGPLPMATLPMAMQPQMSQMSRTSPKMQGLIGPPPLTQQAMMMPSPYSTMGRPHYVHGGYGPPTDQDMRPGVS
jgi:tetratricopeptide (TPR) repeat protein